ncbi:PucR family transcriptional regulator [Streptacidiphilus anmyonensis]|uniref:PucR family transcriptional regulator n=1 Tax=Streptacidiphilus anmyonensis TaxID=405782 RepID=UPI0005A75235|nr:PucR family transcriptional regulator [Streptacidiphilus anmyonensis]
MDESAPSPATHPVGHAPAPGAPAVPLSVLLADPSLGLRHIAGPTEDRLVGTVGTTEVEEPAPYLLSGHMLLTAGVRLPQTPEGVDSYVRSVVGAGAAAIGFGIAPVYDEVPPELVAACDRHGLPLLRVPRETPFVAVGRAAYSAMAEARNRDLRQISDAQSALAAAAGRPDALRAVLHQLSVHLDAWTALADATGRELFADGPRPAAATVQRLRELTTHLVAQPQAADASGADRPRPPSSAAEHHTGFHLTVHTLPGTDRSTAPLVLAVAATKPPTAVHRSVTGVAIVLLSLLTSPRHALGGDARSAGALVRLMLGEAPRAVASALLPPDAPPGSSWVVVHGRYTESTPSAMGRPESDPVQLAALGTTLGTAYLQLDGASLRALVPEHGDSRPTEATTLGRLGWTFGFSAPASATDLAVADNQAARALRRALAVGLPVVRHRVQDQSVHGLVAPADAEALARARFAPLAQARTPGADVLLETLRTWLSLHGSWDRTAAALQLHRNTARQRIGRVAELLDVDLQDQDVRMELWFALRWLPGERT